MYISLENAAYLTTICENIVQIKPYSYYEKRGGETYILSLTKMMRCFIFSCISLLPFGLQATYWPFVQHFQLYTHIFYKNPWQASVCNYIPTKSSQALRALTPEQCRCCFRVSSRRHPFHLLHPLRTPRGSVSHFIMHWANSCHEHIIN